MKVSDSDSRILRRAGNMFACDGPTPLVRFVSNHHFLSNFARTPTLTKPDCQRVYSWSRHTKGSGTLSPQIRGITLCAGTLVIRGRESSRQALSALERMKVGGSDSRILHCAGDKFAYNDSSHFLGFENPFFSLSLLSLKSCLRKKIWWIEV
jgi:hypothetical protein